MGLLEARTWGGLARGERGLQRGHAPRVARRRPLRLGLLRRGQRERCSGRGGGAGAPRSGGAAAAHRQRRRQPGRRRVGAVERVPARQLAAQRARRARAGQALAVRRQEQQQRAVEGGVAVLDRRVHLAEGLCGLANGDGRAGLLPADSKPKRRGRACSRKTSGLPSGWLCSAPAGGRRTGSSHACGRPGRRERTAVLGRARTRRGAHRPAADLAAEAVPQQQVRGLGLGHQAQNPLRADQVRGSGRRPERHIEIHAAHAVARMQACARLRTWCSSSSSSSLYSPASSSSGRAGSGMRMARAVSAQAHTQGRRLQVHFFSPQSARIGRCCTRSLRVVSPGARPYSYENNCRLLRCGWPARAEPVT